MSKLAVAIAAVLLATPALAQDRPAAFAEGGASVLTWTFEQQKFGYRNMEKVSPTHLIKRGEAVRELRKGRQIDPSWTHAGKTWTAESFMEAHRTSGLLVLKDGNVVLERYGLGRAPDERWTSFSVAKSITATLVGAAIKDGHIKSLDDDVATYIPELKGSAYEGVKIRHLLTMRSGVKWNEDYTDMNSDVAKVGLSILEPGVNPVVSYMRKLPRAHAPGTTFTYNTGETDLVGILVSKATGKSLSAYLSEKIWAAYGMDQDAVWVDDVASHERGGCCISMTLRDYSRLGQFMLDGGKTAKGPVLPDGWVEDATTQHVRFDGDGVESGYGYFWWGLPDGYAAEGIFGQQVFVFPKEKVVVAVNSAWPKASDDALWKSQAAMARALRDAAK